MVSWSLEKRRAGRGRESRAKQKKFRRIGESFLKRERW
jgi:hypothetical protein